MANSNVTPLSRPNTRKGELGFLADGGKTAKLMRHRDWTDSPLGPPKNWPLALKSTVALMLPSAAQIVLFWGKDYCALYNDAYAPTIGDKHPSALGRPAREYWAELWDDLKPMLDKVRRTGQTVSAKDRPFYIERHGYPETAYFDISYSPARDENSVIQGVLCIVNETTAEKMAISQVQASEKRFRTLIERSADVIQMVDSNGKLLFSSNSIKNVTGFMPEEIVGDTPKDHVHPDDLPVFQSKLVELLKHPKKPQTLQYRVRHKNGGYVWVETTGTNHLKTPGINALVGNFRDVTGRKEAEDKLKQSEERFRFVVQNASDVITVFDKSGKIKYQSPSVARVLGRRKGRQGANIFKSPLVHPDDQERKNAFLTKLISSKPNTELKDEFRMLHANGSWRSIEAVGINLLHLPVIEGIVMSSRDMTERKAAEQALLESESQKTAFFKTALDAIITMDEEGRIIDANPATERIFGYKRRELVGQEMASLIIPPKYREMHRRGLANYLKTGKGRLMNRRVETEAIRKNGEQFPIELTITEIKSAGSKRLFSGTLRDITERKKATQDLKDSEERFRTLADNVQNLVWIAKPDGWIYWYNQRWYEYTGMTPKQAAGWGWQKAHDPKVLPEVVKRWHTSIKTGKTFDMTFPLKSADGKFRSFLTRITPLKNERGEVIQWLGTNTDVEDLRQKHAIEQRMELMMEQRDTLLTVNRTKDEFIALASHQLRTPATVVKQYISLLLNEFAEPITPDQMQFLQIAYNNNERELTIINDLLKTAQLDSGKYQLNQEPYDLRGLIKEVVSDLQPSFEQRLQTIVFKGTAKNIVAAVDVSELKLVLANLLENASKYSYPRSEIKISLKNIGKSAYITVIDHGVGIGKADQKRIFEKFTRIDNDLSDTVTGTGLGLYWVKHIVELHNGSVKLTSTLGKGTTFTVRLPL